MIKMAMFSISLPFISSLPLYDDADYGPTISDKNIQLLVDRKLFCQELSNAVTSPYPMS